MTRAWPVVLVALLACRVERPLRQTDASAHTAIAGARATPPEVASASELDTAFADDSADAADDESDGDAPWEIRISPDSNYLAYFFTDDSSRAFGAVRAIPNGKELFRTPAVYIEGTDMLVGVAAWSSKDSVAFYLQPDSLPRDHWIRFRTAVRHTGWLIDTVIPR